MAITFPRDLPILCAGVAGETKLKRFQSQSLTGDGTPNVTELAPPIWQTQYAITVTGREAIATMDAWTESLRNGLRAFKGIPIRTGKLYRWPLSRPRGFAGLTVSASPWAGSGVLSAIGEGRDTITIDELPNGLALSPGDYVSFPVGSVQHLFKILEGGTVASNAVTVTIEPTVRQGVAVDEEDPQVVRFEYPFCDMTASGEISKPQDTNVSAVFSFLAYQKPR